MFITSLRSLVNGSRANAFVNISAKLLAVGTLVTASVPSASRSRTIVSRRVMCRVILDAMKLCTNVITLFASTLNSVGSSYGNPISARYSRAHTTSLEFADAAIISACVLDPDTQSCLRLIACTVAPASCPEPPDVDRRTAQSLSDQCTYQRPPGASRTYVTPSACV